MIIQCQNNVAAIARAGAGVNNVPVDQCSQEGIVVFNTPGANANAVQRIGIGWFAYVFKGHSGSH